MFDYPQFNPIAITLGPVQIHWYGLAYLIGFIIARFLGKLRLARINMSLEQFDDLLFYGLLGVMIGGRLGYMLVYDTHHFLQVPWSLFAIWRGGMSFHGGLLGVIIALAAFQRRHRQWSLLDLTDFIAPMVPPGLGLGRLANFINGELIGRVSTSPWAIIYPGEPFARHPSQLYEMLAEGVILFVILWCASRVPRPTGWVSALFLIVYGSLRFLIEFTRQADPQMGLFLGQLLTMGQLLCLLMIACGILLMIHCYREPQL